MRGWVIVVAALVAGPASAWTSATEQRIARDAARLAPPDLRLLLERHDHEHALGLEEGRREETGRLRSQHFTTDGGTLKTRLRSEIRSSIEMVRKREPFRDFVRRLGLIAHLLGDANNPFHVASTDPRLSCCMEDFERYVEGRLDRIRPMFYGLGSATTISAYLDGTISRTMGYYPLLSEEYFRAGRRRTSQEFDDKSTAFGVASLTYSHSVSDLVNVYYYIWQQAGGDVRARPVPRKGEPPPGGSR